MAKSRSRRRSKQSWAARPSPTLSLGHTAVQHRRNRDFLNASDEAFWTPPRLPVRSPLIRTVLIEPEVYQSPPRRGMRSSPLVQVRATLRSSDVQTRSPFLNATMVTPDLTSRALHCAKRGIRREVLFATRNTGKGSKSPRRKPSKVRC